MYNRRARDRRRQERLDFLTDRAKEIDRAKKREEYFRYALKSVCNDHTFRWYFIEDCPVNKLSLKDLSLRFLRGCLAHPRPGWASIDENIPGGHYYSYKKPPMVAVKDKRHLEYHNIKIEGEFYEL